MQTRVVKILENGALDLASKFEGFSRVTLEKSSNFLTSTRPQNVRKPEFSRVSGPPSKNPQVCKMAYFSRILEKPRNFKGQ